MPEELDASRSSSSSSPTASPTCSAIPGTVEQGFLDAAGGISATSTYILTLAGDDRGRHRPTATPGRPQKPAVVQLHSGVGLGNGIGMMYQAMRGHAPLVVIAGESGIKYDAMDAQMAADLVVMARPVTKWATRVVDPHSLLRVLRRAIKIAGDARRWARCSSALPADVLDAVNTEPVVPTVDPDRRAVIPVAGELARGGRHAGGRRAPGDHHRRRRRVSGAQAELTRVAELLGARGLGSRLVRGQHALRPIRCTRGSWATCSARTAPDRRRGRTRS